MSEKQAKRERKDRAPVHAPVKKNKGNVLTNIVIILIVVAIAALGVWAAYGKIKSELPQEQAPVVATIAQLAEAEGTTAEELLAKCGLADAGLTGESAQEELFAVLTVAGYAGYEGKTTDEIKKEYAIEGVEDDMLWQDAQMQIPMSKVAQMQGAASFEEFATQIGLPPEITADMTQGDALDIMQAATEVTEE